MFSVVSGNVFQGICWVSREGILVPRWTILALVLGISTTLDTFHNLGKWPLVMDRLNRFVSKGAILSDVAF